MSPSRSRDSSFSRWLRPILPTVVALAVAVALVMTFRGDDSTDIVVIDTTADEPEEQPADEPDPSDTDGGEEADGDDSANGDSTDDADAPTGGTVDDEPETPAVDDTISDNPLRIALMVADAEQLTPQEVSLSEMLEGNGHRVRPFTVTTEPIVDAVNNPAIDVLLFSPSFVYSLLYFPSDPNALPMLDMARYSWYRRYVLPWSDDQVGPRFSGTGETTGRVYYEDDAVLDWEGQEVGPVQVVESQRFSGEAAMRAAMDHSTNGAAQYFLRHVSDEGTESALGVYVPAGSTITEPAADPAGERQFTSVAPWIGLLLFVDDPEDGELYGDFTSAGEGLIEAALQRLVSP